MGLGFEGDSPGCGEAGAGGREGPLVCVPGRSGPLYRGGRVGYGQCLQFLAAGRMRAEMLLAGMDEQVKRSAANECLNVVLLAEYDVVGEPDTEGVPLSDVDVQTEHHVLVVGRG